MRDLEEDDVRLVKFTYDPAGKSYARQYMSNLGKNTWATRKAQGIDPFAAARASLKARGINPIQFVHASMEAKGMTMADCGRLGIAAQRAQGIDIGARARQALKDRRYDLPAAGCTAALNKARTKLTTLLQDDSHKEAQRWAAEFDAKYDIIGKPTGSLYDWSEFGLLVRNAMFNKECMTRAEMGRILQLGASRAGKLDGDALGRKLRDGLWTAKNMKTTF